MSKIIVTPEGRVRKQAIPYELRTDTADIIMQASGALATAMLLRGDEELDIAAELTELRALMQQQASVLSDQLTK